MIRTQEMPPSEMLARTDDDRSADDIPFTGDIALLRLRAAVHARVLNTSERPVTIGRYTVLDLLGAGGMGVVYAAYDGELDRKVAVKLLVTRTVAGPAAVDDPTPEHRARLLREAQAMARLSHPNVVQIYDVGTRGEQVFIAMELIEGQTLTRWLATPRTWQEVLQKFLAAGRGLSAAHRVGLVHRDFKPETGRLPSRAPTSAKRRGSPQIGAFEREAVCPEVVRSGQDGPKLAQTEGSILLRPVGGVTLPGGSQRPQGGQRADRGWLSWTRRLYSQVTQAVCRSLSSPIGSGVLGSSMPTSARQVL